MYHHQLNCIIDNHYFKKLDLSKRFNMLPLGFIDIGARGGMHDLVFPFAKATSVLGFEPDARACQEMLENPEITQLWAEFFLEPIGLFNKPSKEVLYLLAANTNHSLLPPNKHYLRRYNMKKFEKVGQTQVEVETLDNIYYGKYSGQENFGEFIKVDTQGTEYEILEGSKDILRKNTVAVVCEVSFFEVYQGQKLFSEVEQLLRQYGFLFYGFSTKLHSRSCRLIDKKDAVTRERLMYADAVFFKDPLEGNTNTQRQNESLFVCAMLLGYFDFALEMISKILFIDDEEQLCFARDLIGAFSSKIQDKTHQEIVQLLKRIEENKEQSNVLVGEFVDKRRTLCNYDDVLGVSPLPQGYQS